MPYAGLFGWWIATIAWSIAFPIVVSAYLYRRRPRKRPANAGRKLGRVRDFAFVWFLLGLLAFYVASVGQGSALLFAVGNIAVEGLLILYIFRSGKEPEAATG